MSIALLNTRKKIYLEKVSSDIYEDHFEDGEGEFTGCGFTSSQLARAFDTPAAFFRYISDMYGVSPDSDDYDIEDGVIYTSRMVANHSEAQNGGWFEPTKEELKDFEKGKIKLYTENYRFHYHFIAEET